MTSILPHIGHQRFTRKALKLLRTPGLFARDYFIKRHPLPLQSSAPPALPTSIDIKSPRAVAAALSVNVGLAEASEHPQSAYNLHNASIPALFQYLSSFSAAGISTYCFEKNRWIALSDNQHKMMQSALNSGHLRLAVVEDGSLIDVVNIRVWFLEHSSYRTKDKTAPLRISLDGGIKSYTRTEFDAPGQIDAVITWVDGSDPEWRSMLSEYRAPGDADPDRYVANDELRYVIRSVKLHAPWVRSIYILTNCRAPSWFKETSDVHWVNHTAVIPNDRLPLFNSHAIEAHLHLIEGLSEYFIYLNDDVFISRPSYPSDFFTFTGQSIAKMEQVGRVLEFEDSTETMEEWQCAAANGAKIIQRTFGYYPVRLHQHVVHCYNKSVFREVVQRFSSNIAETERSRFRSRLDVSVASFLYHHYAMATNAGVSSHAKDFLVRHTNYKKFQRTIDAGSEFSYFCLNDGGGSSLDQSYQDFKVKTMSRLFPFASSCER